MLEGLVQNLLLGYLGSYVKNIQKEQLKIGLWNGEVLLENVELNLEAFDNLQLPLSLKQGRVGRLSIKIPWKKLGWDPIIISLENVFICACQRDDHEWSLDPVERREYAVKKARLDAAEVAKLTRRVSPGVSETKIGQTFISHITAKILDGILVSIRDAHFIYTNKQSDLVQFAFGLRFSSLTMKQNITGSSNGKLVDNKVNKIVEISSLGIYCNTSQGTIDQFFCGARFNSNEFDYILVPCDVAVSLMVNRSGQVEDGIPQYSISVELTTLVLQLNEIQMQQILILLDYLETCHLREKYGRFRPCCSTLCSKPEGWQKMWWQYAQESVLSDVRKRLRKTSWRYLGWRISYRRNYVSLYKKFIRHTQPVDKDILLELEQMEKENDVDDILAYRSIAERESQEFLLSSTLPNVGRYSSVGKQQNDEGSSAKAQRGWINLLSLGMLGAGGTEDSIQFSGVVSDEIVKDIYEVTQFYPMSSLEGVALTKNGIFLFSIKFNVHQIHATLLSKTHDRETTKIILDEVNMVFKLWEESWNILMLFNSVEMDNLCTEKVVLLAKRGSTEETCLMNRGRPFITFEVDMSSVNHEPELSIKVVFEPFEVTYESEFLLNLLDFYVVLESFQFQSKRVVSSLNGFEDVNVRLSSKAGYIFSNRTKVIWHASFSTVIIKVPWRHDNSESIMVMELGSLLIRSRNEAESPASVGRDPHTVCSTSYSDMSLGVQLEDLYEHFEIALTSFGVNIMLPNCCQAISIFDRFSASLTLTSCIIPNESMLIQLEVHCSVSSLCVHFSPSIYGALVEMYSCLDTPKLKSGLVRGELRDSAALKFSISADLKCISFHVGVADDVDNSVVLILDLGEVDILCAYQEAMECWFCIKTLEIITSRSGVETSSHTLCSSRTLCTRNSGHLSDIDVGIGVSSDGCGAKNASADGCFLLHYQAQRSVPISFHTCSIYLTDLDFHIYPNIVGLLLKFFDRLSGYGTPSSAHCFKNSLVHNREIKERVMTSIFELQNFGFSNFSEDGTSPTEGLPLDHFPFVTIHNSGSLGSLKLSLIHGIPEWRRHFSLRDRKSVRSPKFSFRKKYKIFSVPNLNSLSHIDLCSAPEGSYDADLQLIDLNLKGVKVYFHDTSCILCTVTLPLCKSLFIVQDTRCVDMLCSIDGLLLSSSWATQNFCEFLWGYSVPNLSPILNIRMRQNDGGALNQNFEISISAQHVCCVLPSEFLAILIGYFSLPDWSPYGNEKFVAENHMQRDTENNGTFLKIEILDSKLILPVECNKGHYLHLELPQLYCSFTTVRHNEDALKDIPLECTVPGQKFVESVHLLNIFGRDSCLSLVLKDNENGYAKLDEDTWLGNISLISPLDVDLWIRIPCESKPFGGLACSTCIMTKVNNCQITAGDDFFLFGLEAVLNVIDEFSAVARESEGFKSDILQFLQFKKALNEHNILSPDSSCVTFKEVKCCVNSLSIKLNRSRPRDSISSEVVASADMRFQFSASFRNEMPLCLDVGFSRLVLHSLHSYVILVQCTSDASVSSVFDIHFAKSNSGVNELLVVLPSVHVWLHLAEWCDFIELLVSYSEQLAQTSLMNASSYNLDSTTSKLTRNAMIPMFKGDLESPMLYDSIRINMDDSIDLIVRSENVGLSLHYPLLVNNEEILNKSRETEINQERLWDFSSDILGNAAMLKGRHCQYVTLNLHSRDSELAVSGNHAKLNCSIEEARGILDTIKEKRILSWSIFQLFQLNVVAVYDDQQKQYVSVEILVDSLDMSVSHQLFYVWHSLRHRIPETGSSQNPFMSMDLKMQLRKASLLVTDETCSCNGPILEILLRNLILHCDTTGSAMEASLGGDLLVNYFNIQKVTWEPFIETWNFLLNMTRTQKQSSPLNTSVMTDIHITSTTQLNLNLTEPIIEVAFRLHEMIKNVWCQVGLNDILGTQRFLGSQTTDSIYSTRYAPYILQNETSLPLQFQVYSGLVNGDDFYILSVKDRNVVHPGSSVPIYTDETPEEQVFRLRPPKSSDRLNEKISYGVVHHMISIQLDGTSGPSVPISMDIVGLRHFEVNFSKVLEKEAVEKNEDASNCKRKIEEKSKMDPNSGFVVPVVFDVSTLHYRKLIRVYSTVILLNTTSIPLELRFDTPFGVSPKVLEQIYPGQEFPLPLHLAEAGRMRWRPLGTGFLWSEAHMFSKGLSQETKLGSFRSFVCYSSHPSSDPFRCCLSIQLIKLASSSGQRNGSSVHMNETLRHSVGNSYQSVHNLQNLKTPSIHYVTLTTPLLVRNYMPKEVSLTIESVGVARTVSISEVDCASIFHIDSSHDLGLVFHVLGYGPSISKFPRAEAFVAVARFRDNKFSQSETLTFYPNSSNGPMYVTVEKTMDAFSGARELCIFVPFLLYNCTGLPITVSDLGHEMEGCTMPPCYHLVEMDQHLDRKHSSILLSSKQDPYATRQNIDNIWNLSSKSHSKENANLHSRRCSSRNFINTDPSPRFLDLGNHDLDFHGVSLNNLYSKDTGSQSQYSEKNECRSDFVNIESRKVKACMYFPHSSSSASELMVRLSTCMPKCFTDNKKSSVWSSPFYLVPASGSTCVVVPQTNSSGAFIVSVTSSPLAGPFSGRTRAITFQPRYVIINTCSKDLCYKQKGTDSVFHLGTGQHSHLHWADPTRELLVSLLYNENGSCWSGSFFPDHLGDTQVKMRNCEGGAMSMIRIEVQNADGTIREEKIVGSPNGNSGTLLVLLSDDKTGFMPYRIDNFSKERLGIYQEPCKSCETTVDSYMSCPYTWDEPCYPHRLVVEVLGERILGSYTLDDVIEQIPIYLPSTSEKPGRQFFISIHADGAVKVLSIMDSSYLPKDMKDSGFSGIKENTRLDQKEEIMVDYCERISVHIPFIGVSLIKSYSQEFLFASANDTRIDLLQSVKQQKFSFQISLLQVDNQLHSTAYPVILSLDHDYGGSSAGQMKIKDDNPKMKNETVLDIASDRSYQPVFFLSAVKWRNKEISLVFFEYIILRLAALRLELEEEVILCLFEFIRSVSSKMQSRALSCLDSSVNHLANDTGSVKGFSVRIPHYESLNVNRGQHLPMSVSKYLENCRSNPSLPSVVPIEDFWQQIYFLARRQNKIYVEVFDLAPIKLTLSFSSAPWMLRNEGPTSAEYPSPISGTAFQRGLMALADVEGAPIYLKQLVIAHHMGTSESFNEILIRHYTPQLLHEMYKIFGSASVIGNPMGFAKNLGLGIKDFLSVPATGILKSPSGLFTGMAQGTTSLFYSTVYAISNAATQFSKSVHKSIVAFTFDEQAVSTMEKQWTSLASHSKGVLNEFLEALTGFLQSPIRGAEKHGLPGFVSGVALGTAGLVARPVASILEVTGKTAQSIRNRSRLHRSRRFRKRLRRLISRELPLRPYSWEEAIGISLLDADDVKLKDEIFVTCRTLKQRDKFLIITERLVLVVMCSRLIGFGTPEFRGIADLQWEIEVEMSLNNVIYVGKEMEQVNIVAINSETPLKQHQHKIGIRRTKWWIHSTPLPLFQMTSVELEREEEAENVLQVLLSMIEQRKEQGFGVHVLHRSSLR